MTSDMNTYTPAGKQARPRAEAQTIDIVAFVLALFVPIAGLIMGHIARGQAKRRGFQPCALNTWTIVLGWLFTVLAVVIIVYLAVAAGVAVDQLSNDYCFNHPFAARCS
jgi:hypothetical protein